MSEGVSAFFKVLLFSIAQVLTTALFTQLILLYYGGVLELFESIGITFVFRNRFIEALLIIVFFYYIYNMTLFRVGAILTIVVFAISAFVFGRITRSPGQALMIGIISPYIALAILIALTYDPIMLLEFSFSYGYTPFQSIIGAIFALIGAYSTGE